MHPFGGIPICPRCSKQVYAAEQVMGPGRKLYHKPCLACTLCNKRLDSLTLLEHDQQPYCKLCHIKNFGTRDLRHANLPNREDMPSSPTKASQPPLPLPPRIASPIRSNQPLPPLLKPTRSLASPTGIRSPTIPRNNSDSDRNSEKDNESDSAASSAHGRISPFPPLNARTLAPQSNDSENVGALTNMGRPGNGNIPRTVPLSPTRSVQPLATGDSISSTASAPRTTRPSHHSSRSLGSIPLSTGILPAATGTRYGALLNRGAGANGLASVNLTGNAANSPRRWGGETPSCPRCSKSVYFAEQVKAIGKTYHKGCLRCSECNTRLDSSRLRDHDGEPYCTRCYGKLHGPQGGGYALLGKPGG
ncbi:hypothetical protein AX17_006153 [Amanita inopinata Kibby_2008]|nr:hypothetical protein AX17_006153 [Amanita inopinata Kibby_2008]